MSKANVAHETLVKAREADKRREAEMRMEARDKRRAAERVAEAHTQVGEVARSEEPPSMLSTLDKSHACHLIMTPSFRDIHCILRPDGNGKEQPSTLFTGAQRASKSRWSWQVARPKCIYLLWACVPQIFADCRLLF